MKKILNIGLVVMTVVALSLVGCKNPADSPDAESILVGNTKIENGTFAEKGITGVPASTITIAESADTGGIPKVVKLVDGDKFKLFGGRLFHGAEVELFMDAPRSIKVTQPQSYYAYYTFYDYNLGGVSTQYYGWTNNGTVDYPKFEDMQWTKYTYYDGSDEEHKYQAVWLNDWNENSNSARYVISVDGKWFGVYSYEGEYSNSSLTGSGDTVTYEWNNEWTNDDNKRINSEKIVFKNGGECTYFSSQKEYDASGDLVYEYTISDKDGNPVKCVWANNNGLIQIICADSLYHSYGKDYDNKGYQVLNYTYYWNGKNLNGVNYMGAYYTGEIPDAAKNTTNIETWNW